MGSSSRHGQELPGSTGKKSSGRSTQGSCPARSMTWRRAFRDPGNQVGLCLWREDEVARSREDQRRRRDLAESRSTTDHPLTRC